MFMTGVMSCLWQCHVSLMQTPSDKVLPFMNPFDLSNLFKLTELKKFS